MEWECSGIAHPASPHYLEVLENAAETRQRLGDGQGQEEDGQQSWGPYYRHPGIA